jgi:hypothetical protein
MQGSMEELLTLPEPSNQGPLHLPDAPPGFEERNAMRERRQLLLANDDAQQPGAAAGSEGEPQPQHCSRVEQTCGGIGSVTTKQRRKMAEISALTMHPLPDISAMTFNDADAFLSERFAHWMAHDYPR